MCVHEQFFGPCKRGKHSCVSTGSAISFENGACRSAKKQSWSAATRLWCRGPGLSPVAYKPSITLRISAGGGEASPQSRS